MRRHPELALAHLVASARHPNSHSRCYLIEVHRERCPMGESSDGQASTQQAGFPGVTRTVLERLPLPGDHRELVVVEVTGARGSEAPLHRHPVGGVVFIIEGVAESAY